MAEFQEIDKRWGEREFWLSLQELTRTFTSRHYLQSLDLQYDVDAGIERVDESQRIYLTLFLRTLWVSLSVTFFCLVIGYPIAFAIANTPKWSRIVLIFVLLPFWTSLLVRTTTWIVLLQNQGVLNDLMVGIGLIDDSSRIAMVHNLTGTLIAMTHVLLPFMVLPLYSVMSSIPSTTMRAATSLGANPLQALTRVYWPQSLPGVAAGGLLVFILSIGYYITPALVGGQDGQLISNLIAYHLNSTLNWPLAAALSTLLMLLVIVFYFIYDRLVGVDNLRVG